MTTTTKICRTCGATFAASRTGVTVRCIPCRKPAAKPAPAPASLTTAPAPEGVTCTYGPFATTGLRCGAPAVVTFTVRGVVYAECAEHRAV